MNLERLVYIRLAPGDTDQQVIITIEWEFNTYRLDSEDTNFNVKLEKIAELLQIT